MLAPREFRREVQTATVNRITTSVFSCGHAHLRQKELCDWMLKMLTDNGFHGYVLDMPNTIPAILTGQQANEREQDILARLNVLRLSLVDSSTFRGFQLIMTIQITEQTTPAMIREAWNLGVRHAKVYPKDVTTNSELGVSYYPNIYPALTEAEKLGMFIHFHGEHPSYDVEGKDKEDSFLQYILKPIVLTFPKLKVVLEHISTWKAVRFVEYWYNSGRNIAGTIAPQYFMLTQDDVIGYSRASECKGNSHHLCKPMLKWRKDRDAIRKAAVSGKPYFFLGTDTAPHLTKAKYCIGCSCGIFNTEVAGPLTVQLFEEEGKLDGEKISYFTSHALTDWFGLPRVAGTITFERKDWKVQPIYPVLGTNDGVVGMCAGWTLPWQRVR